MRSICVAILTMIVLTVLLMPTQAVRADPDIDAHTIPNNTDNCPLKANPGQILLLFDCL
jgi:hypothetical protein